MTANMSSLPIRPILRIDLDAVTDEEVSTDCEEDMQTDAEEEDLILDDIICKKESNNSCDNCVEPQTLSLHNQSVPKTDFNNKCDNNSDDYLEESNEDIFVEKIILNESELKSMTKLNDLKKEPVDKKDVSTDTRFIFRSFDYDLIDRNTGFIRNSSSTSISRLSSSSSSRQDNDFSKVILCFRCQKRFAIKNECKAHYKSSHPSEVIHLIIYREENCIKPKDSTNYTALSHKPITESIENNLSINGESTKSSELLMRAKSSLTLESQSEKIPKKVSKSCSLDINSSNTSAITTEIASKLQFRISYQCKICSFTPLFQPKESIKSHVEKEHNKSGKEGKKCYQKVLVKTHTRNTIL